MRVLILRASSQTDDQCTFSFSAITAARGAMYGILDIIRRPSPIDASSNQGQRLEKVDGKITLKNVEFHYPNRKDVQVLKQYSLEIRPGKTYALVGHSGCGKSTIIQLCERFYDPISGQICLDDVELRELNVEWLRQQIGLVSQEPTLFSGTIAENIAYGKPGASQEEVEMAAKMANAHNFIQKLPQKYQTVLGEGGALISGGQKQRIAIARALVKDPKILLLDEATAALDSSSERVVQDALDRASKTRTTIVIAHRLSTIRNADCIIVMDAGQIVEMGTHSELVAKKSAYYNLVQAQQLHARDDDITEAHAVEDVDEVAVTPEQANISIKVESPKSIQDLKKESALEGPDSSAKVAFKDVPLLRIAALNRPEWPILVVGALGACAHGTVMPVFALIYSEILNSLFKPTDEMLADARFWAGMFVVLAVATGTAIYLQTAMFEVSGIRLTFRIRQMLFKAIIRQDIAFFDDDTKNSVGVLSAKLASDVGYIQGLTGQLLGTIVQTIATLVAGFTIAFVNGWQLTLIILAILPVMAAGQALQLSKLKGVNKHLAAYRDAGQLVSESVQAIRTVASLGAEKIFLKRYANMLVEPHKANLKATQSAGFSFGLSQGVIFLGYAAAFYAGSQFILNGGYSFLEMNTTLSAVIFTAMSAGNISSFAPNISKAKSSAVDVFKLIDSPSSIDPLSNEGTKLEKVKGEITLKNVKFAYPRRADVNVMSSTSIKINPGETVAFVGESGCGKSTIIWLLERFYDPQAGEALIDGVDIKELNPKWLRQQLGLVTQEPRLFSYSIGENIAYGRLEEGPDGSVRLNATQEEIEAAAKAANIHSFIDELPEKYNTSAGEKVNTSSSNDLH